MLATLGGENRGKPSKGHIENEVSIEKVKELAKKEGLKGFKNLVQMIYHPNESRFYKQVAI